MHFARLSTAVGPSGTVLLLAPQGKVYRLERTLKSENRKLTERLFKQHWIRSTQKTFSRNEVREKICKANNVPFEP
jgi:hypothetical protein